MRTQAEVTWLANKRRTERRRAIGRGVLLGLALGTPAILAAWHRRTGDEEPAAVAVSLVPANADPAREAPAAPKTESADEPRGAATPPSSDDAAAQQILDLAALRSPSATQRALAIRHLGAAALDPADLAYFEGLLIQFARAPTADDRLAAIDVIGARASARPLTVLHELLACADAGVVAAAARAAGNARFFSARDTLVTLLGNADADVDVEAAIALDRLNDSEGRERLVALATDVRSVFSAVKAFNALDRDNDHRVTSIALGLLAKEVHPDLLSGACRTLGDRRVAVTETQMAAALSHPETRTLAEYALAAGGQLSFLGPLVDAASDPSEPPHVRIPASILLLKFDVARFRPEIERWHRESNDDFYRAQISAILESGK